MFDDKPEPSPVASSVQEMRAVLNINLDRIRNMTEVLACRMLERKLQNMPEVSRSKGMIEDIYCLAMNRIPPLYYHSASSFARRVDDQGPPVDIMAAIDSALDHAIIQVVKHPHRD